MHPLYRRLPIIPTGQDFSTHLSEVESAAAHNVSTEVVAQATAKWAQQHAAQSASCPSGTLPHGIETPHGAPAPAVELTQLLDPASAIEPSRPEPGNSRLSPPFRNRSTSQAASLMSALIAIDDLHSPGATTASQRTNRRVHPPRGSGGREMTPKIIKWRFKKNYPLLCYRVRRPHNRGTPQ